jgi:hypothetical protein
LQVIDYGGFEVLTAVTVKNIIFWDVTLCIPVDVHRCFEERNASIFRIEEGVEQVTSNKLAPKQSKLGEILFALLVACFLLGSCFGLHLNPEYGGNTFMRNIDKLQRDYTSSHPRTQYSLSNTYCDAFDHLLGNG